MEANEPQRFEHENTIHQRLNVQTFSCYHFVAFPVQTYLFRGVWSVKNMTGPKGVTPEPSTKWSRLVGWLVGWDGPSFSTCFPQMASIEGHSTSMVRKKWVQIVWKGGPCKTHVAWRAKIQISISFQSMHGDGKNGDLLENYDQWIYAKANALKCEHKQIQISLAEEHLIRQDNTYQNSAS